MRGRRVALLLTGAIPLLAKDDDSIASLSPITTSSRRPSLKETVFTADGSSQDDPASMVAAEALHDDTTVELLPVTQLPEELKDLALAVSNLQEISHEQERKMEPNYLESVTPQEPRQLLPTQLLQPELLATVRSDQSENSDEQNDRKNTVEEEMGTSKEESQATEEDGIMTADDERAESSNARDEGTETGEAVTDETHGGGLSASEADAGMEAESPRPKSDDDEEEEGSLAERVFVDYASKSAGALILEKSPGFKGTSNLLNGDKDKYAIAPCEDRRFVVIGLSEDIMVEQVVVANYERYSSHTKDIQILGSQTMGNWVDLGTYTTEPGHGAHRFGLREPSWARYLKFKFLTHYGMEHFCTVSQISVHGRTMLQGFHEQWKDEEGKTEEIEGEEESLEMEPADVPSENATYEDKPLDTVTNTTSGAEDRIESNTTPSTPLPSERGTENATHKHKEAFSNLWQTCPLNNSEFRSMHALTSTSVPVFSSWSVNANAEPMCPLQDIDLMVMGSTPSLSSRNLVSDAIQSVSVVAGAADSLKAVLSPTVSDAVKHIQQTIKTKIGGGIDTNVENVGMSQRGDSSVGKTEADTHGSTKGQGNGEDENKTVGSGTSEGVESNKTADSRKESPPESLETNNLTTVGAISEEEVNESVDIAQVSPERPRTGTTAPADPAEMESLGQLHEIGVSLAQRFSGIPSAKCLADLDFARYKEGIIASRKVGMAGGASQPGMEPIFKKLTDEIKALQVNLSVHDQFAKAAVACYQRVLLDMAADIDALRGDQEARLVRLEMEMQRLNSSRLFAFARGLIGPPLHRVYILASSWFSAFVGWLQLTRRIRVLRQDEIPFVGGLAVGIALVLLLFRFFGIRWSKTGNANGIVKENNPSDGETGKKDDDDDDDFEDLCYSICSEHSLRGQGIETNLPASNPPADSKRLPAPRVKIVSKLSSDSFFDAEDTGTFPERAQTAGSVSCKTSIQQKRASEWTATPLEVQHVNPDIINESSSNGVSGGEALEGGDQKVERSSTGNDQVTAHLGNEITTNREEVDDPRSVFSSDGSCWAPSSAVDRPSAEHPDSSPLNTSISTDTNNQGSGMQPDWSKGNPKDFSETQRSVAILSI